MKNVTKNNINMAQKLIQLSESMLNEAGTPTTALPPSTNATRQLQQDMATTGKEGIPAPVGAEPSENNGETAMGSQDPNGEDAPADIKANYAKQGETSGMQIPADIKPDPQGPATDTTAPGTDDSAGQEAEVAKAKAKKGLGLRVESLSFDEIVDSLIEHFGGTDELIFALVADGASFALAEALIEGELEIDERIDEKIRDFAAPLLGESDDEELDEAYELVAGIQSMEEAAAIIIEMAEHLDEGIFKSIASKFSKGPKKVGGSRTFDGSDRKEPMTQKGKEAKARSRAGAYGSKPEPSSPKMHFSNGDKPPAAWSGIRREGPAARRNR